MTDDKFLERANRFHISEDAAAKGDKAKFYTQEEYRTETEAIQKNKDGKLVILYTTNPVQQDAYLQAALQKGYKVVKAETLVDAAFINHMEMKWENIHFTRVDADIADNLIDKQENTGMVLSSEEESRLKELFTVEMPQMHVTVDIKGLSKETPPVVATRPEFMRRMKDMAAVSGQMGGFYASMPDEVTLTVNGNHPIFQHLLSESDIQKQEKQARNLADLALLSQGLLKGVDLTAFINRSVELMGAEKKSAIILQG